jgi:hypothetical protein
MRKADLDSFCRLLQNHLSQFVNTTLQNQSRQRFLYNLLTSRLDNLSFIHRGHEWTGGKKKRETLAICFARHAFQCDSLAFSKTVWEADEFGSEILKCTVNIHDRERERERERECKLA